MSTSARCPADRPSSIRRSPTDRPSRSATAANPAGRSWRPTASTALNSWMHGCAGISQLPVRETHLFPVAYSDDFPSVFIIHSGGGRVARPGRAAMHGFPTDRRRGCPARRCRRQGCVHQGLQRVPEGLPRMHPGLRLPGLRENLPDLHRDVPGVRRALGVRLRDGRGDVRGLRGGVRAVRRRMHEVRRRALLQGVCGGLPEMPRCVPSDAAVSSVGWVALHDSRNTK
jgi:hypothetical protein